MQTADVKYLLAFTRRCAKGSWVKGFGEPSIGASTKYLRWQRVVFEVAVRVLPDVVSDMIQFESREHLEFVLGKNYFPQDADYTYTSTENQRRAQQVVDFCSRWFLQEDECRVTVDGANVKFSLESFNGTGWMSRFTFGAPFAPAELRLAFQSFLLAAGEPRQAVTQVRGRVELERRLNILEFACGFNFLLFVCTFLLAVRRAFRPRHASSR